MVETGDEARRDRGTMLDETILRCRRCGDLLARWQAVVGQPGEDLDPDTPAGLTALALWDAWEADLRWLEANPARTLQDAEAKLSLAMSFAELGSAEVAPRYHAFLLQAQSEVLARSGVRQAGGVGTLAPARGWLWWIGLQR